MTSHDAVWRLQEPLHLLQFQKVDVHIARPIAFKMSESHLSIPSIIAQSVNTTKITLTANYCESLTI